MKFYQFKVLTLLVFLSFTQLVKSQNTLSIYNEDYVTGSVKRMGSKNEGANVFIDPKFTENPSSGSNCLKVVADTSKGASWSGFFLLSNGERKVENGKYTDLSKYKYLVFNCRSNGDYNIAKLGMGEESETSVYEKGIPLSKDWKRFVFEVSGERSNISALFFIVFEGKGEAYIDNIYYADSTFKTESSDMVYLAPAAPMDEDAYYIFSDKLDHGIPSGFMGEKNGTSIKMNPDCREKPFHGSKCIKFAIDQSETWRGLYIFSTGSWEPSETQIKMAPNLSEYDKLVFYARSDSKQYIIPEIGFGQNSPEKDEASRNDVYVEITPNWRKYEIPLKGLDRTSVNALLYMNLNVGTFYLDEVKFVKSNKKSKQK